MRDAWRLAVGTLTAVPVAPPGAVDKQTAGGAMLLAPLAVAPLGILVAAVCWLGERAGLNPLAVAVLAVGALAGGSRAIHWDGLSDTADGLTASYDRARSLAVMKTGTSGPAGVVATVIVLGVQAASLTSFQTGIRSAVLAGVLVCVSRVALAITCVRGVPAARPDGLGMPHAQSVSPLAALVVWLLSAVVVAGLTSWAGLPAWRGGLAVALAVLVVVVLVRRAVQRFGGVTGDVFGAAIELSLATLLVALT